MKKLWKLLIVLCSLGASCAFAGCSDSDTPADDSLIGAPTDFVYLVYTDTIETASDGWTLNKVYLYTMREDRIKEFTPNLKARKSFSYTADWLTLSYSNKKLILSAEPRALDDFSDKSFIIELTKGDETVQIEGDQYLPPPEPMQISPKQIEFGAAGGEAIVTVPDGTWVIQIRIGSRWFLYESLVSGTKTAEWLTVEKLTDTEWLVTVDANDTGADRESVITFELEDLFAQVNVAQSAMSD